MSRPWNRPESSLGSPSAHRIDHLALLHRVTALQPVGGSVFRPACRRKPWEHSPNPQTFLQMGLLAQQVLEFAASFSGSPVTLKSGSFCDRRQRARDPEETTTRQSSTPPLPRDTGQAIRKLLLPVLLPYHAVDRHRRREFEFDPALPAFVGDPTRLPYFPSLRCSSRWIRSWGTMLEALALAPARPAMFVGFPAVKPQLVEARFSVGAPDGEGRCRRLPVQNARRFAAR